MSDLIDRQAVLNAIENEYKGEASELLAHEIVNIMAIIDDVPPVNPQPCEDVISRQAACDYIAEFVNNEYSTQAECEMVDAMIEGIQHLPPVNPQPKTGHWIATIPIKPWFEYRAECSECHCFGTRTDKYCRSCGAKMVEPVRK